MKLNKVITGIGVCLFIVLLLVLLQKPSSPSLSQQTHTEVVGDDVLAEFTATGSGSLIVNVPAEFTEDVNIRDKTLDLGNGVIIARNIITDLVNGQGIQVVQGEGQERTIVNTDPGSGQKIFGAIRVEGTEIQADSNTSVLEFEAGEGLDLAIENGKVVLKVSSGSGTGSSSVTNITNITNTTADESGFEDGGTNVALKTASDTVTIGTDIAQGKLTVESSAANQTGLVVEAAAGQTANLSEWRDSDGSTVISFDKEGNATFKGVISQDGFTFSGGTVNFTGDDDTVLFDIKSDEPSSLFANGGVDTGLTSWTSSTPTATNIATNGEFTSNQNSWVGEIQGSPFPELFSNTGFETDTGSWSYNGGGLYAYTEFDTVTATPYHVTTGPDGNIWYTTTSNKIGKMTLNGVVTEYTTPSTLSIGQITPGPDGNVWYISSVTNKVGKIVPATGVITEYTVTSGGVGITTGPDGNIWYTMGGQDRIGRMTTAGVILGDFFFPTADSPRDISSGPDGKLYISFETGNQVGQLTTAGSLTIVGNTGSLVRGNTIGPDGNVYAAIFTGGQIAKYNIAANTFDTFTVATGVYDIINGPNDGYLWYSRTGSRTINRFSTSGTETTFSGTGSGNIRGITLGPDNNVWYASETTNKIGKFQINGPERATSPTFAQSSGVLKVPQMNPAVKVRQSLNVGDTRQYVLSVNAYIDGSTPVTSTHAQLVVNDTLQSTTYTSLGGGWYKLSAVVTGANASVPYGVQVNANNQVYLDAFSMKAATTSEWVVSPAYNGPGATKLTAPAGNNATLVQTKPFPTGGYTLTAYAYTNGSAVTTSDIDLMFNGSAIPTTISSTATPGWYKLEGAITVNSDVSAAFGARAKANKIVYVDAVSIVPSSVASSITHSTASPTFGGSAGAVRINSIGRSTLQFTQNVAVPSDDSYLLRALVYNNTPGETAGTIDSSRVQLVVNNSVVSNTNYASAGNGFYTVTAETFIAAGTYPIGLQIPTGYRLVADSFALTPGAGNDKTVLISNSGSGKAKLEVESTTTLNSGDASNKALVVKGFANQMANLTEWQDSTGTALSVIDEDGHLGIGTASPTQGLTVLQNEISGDAAAFVNANTTDAPTSSVLRISTGVASTGVDTRFVQFYAGASSGTDGTGVGRIRLNNGGVAYESGGADFAEYFTSAFAKSNYEAGEIVALTKAGTVDTTTRPYDSSLVGVVSNTAAFVGNAKDDATSSAQILVGLIGQIPVKVTTLNGPIRPGDAITASELRGVGMKATKPGMILGRALEGFSEEAGTPCSRAASPDVVSDERVASPSATVASGSANLATGSANMQNNQLKCGTIRIYLNPGIGGEGEVLAEATTSAPLSLLDEETRVFDGGISVLGMANVTDLAVTNSISAGLLSINGLTEEGNATVDTLTGSLLLQSQAQGAIEFMGGRVRVSQQGDVDIRTGNLKIGTGILQGNDQFVGMIKMKAGIQSVRVEKQWRSAPVSVHLTPEYDTKIWARDISSTGFTIFVSDPPTEEVTVRWSALFIE